MDSSVFLGGSVIAAVVAGAIALFAPCCISIMLPAYFASSFQNRRVLTAMTFVFAAGIATVILPIALGAAALRHLLLTEHTAIYLAGGAVMLGLAAYTLLGGRISLPMPGRRAGARQGPFGVYTLGLFSGVASFCCAPVLAGVIALSGLSSSFAVALGLGGAYLFGMVAPWFASHWPGNAATGRPAGCSGRAATRGGLAPCGAHSRAPTWPAACCWR